MNITKEEAIALLKFMNNQFIDLNSTKLYNGLVIKQLLDRMDVFVEDKQCNARHSNGWAVCNLLLGHSETHKDFIGAIEWE